MERLSRPQNLSQILQLLQLLESSTQDVQKQTLAEVKRQNPSWAALLQAKLLTVERVCQWPTAIIKEVASQLDDSTLIPLVSDLLDPAQSTLLNSMSSEQRVRVTKSVGQQTKFRPGEASAARIAFVAKVRELERTGQIDLTIIAPNHASSPGAA